MMRVSPSAVFAALLSAATLLAGCCANNTCNCKDELEDAIQVKFKISNAPPGSDPTAFRPDEVDTVTLVRYRLPVLDTTVTPHQLTTFPRPDTVVLTTPASRATGVISLANAAPFALSGALRVNRYRYAVLLTDNNRLAPRVRQRFDLTSVYLKGRYQGDGCCTCYQNVAKTAYLKTAPAGSAVPAADSTLRDLKQVVELSRP